MHPLTIPLWLGIGLSLALAVVAGVLMLSPGLSGPPIVPHLDKALHAFAFKAIVLPAALVLPRQAWLVAALAVVYGGAIELIQPLNGRGAEWLDWLADALGAGAGLLAARWLRPSFGQP